MANRKREFVTDFSCVGGPTVALISGNYFNLLNPDASSYDIVDVAWHLSNICRSNGGTSRHYSVAQHSVHVSEMVPDEHAYEALLHDAAEFVTGDMTRPMKLLCPDFCAHENRIQESVLRRFGVSLPLHACVHEADNRMFATEQQQLYHSRVRPDVWAIGTGGLPPYEDFHIPHWGPASAYAAFMQRYNHLQTKKATKCL